MFKVGDKVVRRGSIHYVSKSFSLWEVVSVLQTTIPCIEAAPLTRNGKIVHARVGVYAQQQFDHATPEEIAAGHRIESSNSQAISDCSLSNLCQNDTQNSLSIKQENQDMGDDSHGDYTQMTLEQLQQEHAELLLFNDELDRNCKAHKAKANKYQTKCWHIQTLLMNPVDKDMTLKAIKTVIERVGEE